MPSLIYMYKSVWHWLEVGFDKQVGFDKLVPPLLRLINPSW